MDKGQLDVGLLTQRGGEADLWGVVTSFAAHVGRFEGAEKDLLVRKLIEHYPTQGDKPCQNVRLALTAVGVSLA